MRELEALTNIVLARTSRELVGAMFIATALALVSSVIYRLARRKVSDTSTIVVGVALFGNIAGMLIGAFFIQTHRPEPFPTAQRKSGADSRDGNKMRHANGKPFWGHNDGFPFGPTTGFHMMFAADLNRDGRLTAEELTRFLEKVDVDNRGSADIGAIDKYVFRRMTQSPLGPPSIAANTPRPDASWGPGIPDKRWRRRMARHSDGPSESHSDDPSTLAASPDPATH